MPALDLPFHAPRSVPFGPTRAERGWMRLAACAHPDVDPALFTSEENDRQAVDAARAICRAGCPVFLLCRLYAEETGEFGVYAAETYAERTRRLRSRARLLAELDREGAA